MFRSMKDSRMVAQQFLAALPAKDADAFEAVLAPDAGLRWVDLNVIKSMLPVK